MVDDLESFWDVLLTFVEARSVAVLTGPDLALVPGGEGVVPVERLLAQGLAERLHLAGLGAWPRIQDVARAWSPRTSARRQAFYRELGVLASRMEVPVPVPLQRLARVEDLRLFVTFCPDDLLTKALDQERHAGQAVTQALAFTPGAGDDLPADLGDGTCVYHLFGRYGVLPRYVAAEEDVLEWIGALQVPQKRPERLFDALAHHHLLFLGCDFPDWLARFVLRTTRNRPLSSARDVGEILVDARARPGDPFVVFLDGVSEATQVIPMDPVSFVTELERRWQARRNTLRPPPVDLLGPLPQEAPPGCVFISYASEDRPAALQVAVDLQLRGLTVWLDRQQLDWGCDYTRRIERAIRQSAVFIPLLSATTRRRVGYFRKEWAWAVDRNLEFTGADVRFLCPLVIDDTPMDADAEIPSAFSERHVERAPGGCITPAQQDAIITAWTAMRRRLGIVS